MTRDEILNMPAGREMDKLIAEKVMGESLPTLPHEHNNVLTVVYSEKRNWYCLPDYYKGDECEWEPRSFSTYIEPAWEVVEKGSRTMLEQHENEWWCEYAGKDTYTYHATAETAPLAICRAALLSTLEEK